MSKRIYNFTEGNASMRSLLGGKGANLAEMTKMGLPVPSGFVITTEACNEFLETGDTLTNELRQGVKDAIAELEGQSDKEFGCPDNPLLVSVRSGGAISMPGMMDTILNLGLNDDTVEGLSNLTDNPRFAYDCYRRLLQMYGDVVLGIHLDNFEDELADLKDREKVGSDSDLSAESLKELCETYKEIYVREKEMSFPQDPMEQLILAIEAVFSSWSNPRAVVYRDANNIPHNLGTAVNVQMMVYGNFGDTSGTGVVFSRNPATGEKGIFGELLINAQGEDVVAGIRNPEPISNLKKYMPDIYKELDDVCDTLEHHFKDMQDIEFTIEEEKLYILQTRTGKRTAQAAFNIAYDLEEEGITTKEESLLQIDANSIDQLLHPIFDPKELAKQTILATGLPASPGAACGAVYFTSEEATRQAATGKAVILMRRETSPDDIEGLIACAGVVTSSGGMTSHAAVVARGLGKCCVAGCEKLRIYSERKVANVGNVEIKEGDIISLDGSTGNIYIGEIATTSPEPDKAYSEIMKWANETRRLQIYANADTKQDIQTARDFGAEGVGLARTEHMFFEKRRLEEMRILILSNDQLQRKAALSKLLVMQIQDFNDLYETMSDRPITIRLLDPPLHEFLPRSERDINILANEINVSTETLRARIGEMTEVNPMLGHRGVRLGVTSPEIYQMQVEAIMRSALGFLDKGITIKPEIMIPLIGTQRELVYVKKSIESKIQSVFEETGKSLEYNIGTMIEIPRACLRANLVAEHADFFSFGTNDLTQMTFGYSRDDVGKFMQDYLKLGILSNDPFQVLDCDGVGQLISMAVEKGRKVKPDMPIGVCGEVGGDPHSIMFFEQCDLTYVSCSPYRLPIARLASAQAAIVRRNKEKS